MLHLNVLFLFFNKRTHLSHGIVCKTSPGKQDTSELLLSWRSWVREQDRKYCTRHCPVIPKLLFKEELATPARAQGRKEPSAASLVGTISASANAPPKLTLSSCVVRMQ